MQTMIRRELELDAEVDGMLGAIFDLQRANISRWPTWRRVSKLLRGTEEEADRYAAIAALPEYRPLFVVYQMTRIRLSPEGMERHLSAAAPSPPDTNSPLAVATSIRRYASKLRRMTLKAAGVERVTTARNRLIQLMRLETVDGIIPTMTPVEYRPDDRGAWTRATVVGQESRGGGVYLSLEREIFQCELPGTLAVDRGFLLNELACRIERLAGAPNQWTSLLQHRDEVARASSCGDASDVADRLAIQVSPWSRLLWGPPGSGKTYAIARLVAAKIRREPGSRILLLAPSNLAADVLLEEVLCQLETAGLSGLVSDRKVLRYGYARKHSLLTRPEILAPRGGEVLANRVHGWAEEVATAERNGVPDSSMASMRASLLAAQEELRQSVERHAQTASIVATTTVQTYLPNNPIAASDWALVAVDEATMMAPAVAYHLSAIGKQEFLMAGDPRQLGPVVEAEAGASSSTCKWMGTDVFEVCGASSGFGPTRRVSEKHPSMVRITEQRRCAPGIWSEIKHLYDGVHCRTSCSSSRATSTPIPQANVVLMDTTNSGAAPCRPKQRSWLKRVLGRAEY